MKWISLLVLDVVWGVAILAMLVGAAVLLAPYILWVAYYISKLPLFEE
jgi:hypothetical protein